MRASISTEYDVALFYIAASICNTIDFQETNQMYTSTGILTFVVFVPEIESRFFITSLTWMIWIFYLSTLLNIQMTKKDMNIALPFVLCFEIVFFSVSPMIGK